MLGEYALVTLFGPGGVGKTTLAMQLASAVSDDYEDGVVVVELSGLSDDDDVVGSVARQLGATSLEGFRLRAADEDLLVVLDNCESAPIASRTIATDLVASGVTVVATSRSPLHVMGERVVPIRPLATPDDDREPDASITPAEHLFLVRAAEAGSTWEHSAANLAAVRRVVRQLSGLPLAIELAAARSRVLAPAELVELLDRHLDVLVRPGGSSDRHHSLRSAIESSYEPLSEEQRHVLRFLSFMSTSFDLRVAHAVAGGEREQFETLELISDLVDASLVDVRETPAGRTEYVLLDSIRAYGREQLSPDEWSDAGTRYADAITELAGETVAAALVAFSPEVMAAIRDNTKHLISAIGWCLENDATPARAYQMSLLFYGPNGATDEIAELAARIRSTWDQDAPLRAESFAVMGSLTYRVGRYAEGAELAAQAAAHPDATPMAKFMANRTLGYEAAIRRDVEAAAAYIETAMSYGPAFSAAFDREIRISRAVMEWSSAGSRAAVELLDGVIAEAAEAEEWVNVAWARTVMGYHYRLLGDLEAARRVITPAVEVAERSATAWAQFTAYRSLALQSALDSSWEVASEHFRRALDTAAHIGDVDSTTIVLRSAAGAAAHLGEADVAAELSRITPPGRGVAVPPSPFEAEERALRDQYAVAEGCRSRYWSGAPVSCSRATLHRRAPSPRASTSRPRSSPSATTNSTPRCASCAAQVSASRSNRRCTTCCSTSSNGAAGS